MGIDIETSLTQVNAQHQGVNLPAIVHPPHTASLVPPMENPYWFAPLTR